MKLSESNPNRHLDGGGILLCVCIATILLFKEILLAPNTIALGESEVDLPAQLWILWWNNHPERDLLVNAPFGGVDFYVLTPIHDWVAALVYPNVVLAHNLTTWIGMVLAIVGGVRLGRHFGETRLAALFGGLAVLGSAPLIAAFRDGTGEFIWVGLLAFAMVFADRLRKDGCAHDVGWLTVTLIACFFSSWYYGAAALLMVGVLFCVSGLNRWKMLGAMAMSLLCVAWWIAQFTNSDFEVRPVQETLLAQLKYGGTGPVADAGMRDLSWMARTQLSLMEEWWMDLWVWSMLLVAWSGFQRFKDAFIWFWVCGLAFLVGIGSFSPSGWSLPMLYGNRLLEWFGVGMHLPFHISTVGVLSLIVLGVHASRRVVTVGVVLMGLHGAWSLHQTVRWVVPTYDDLPTLQGVVMHVDEISEQSHQTLNDIMLLQMAHGQPMASFPVFPTNLRRMEGINSVREHLDEEVSLKTFQASGVNTIISPIAMPIQELSDCCLSHQTTDWNVYMTPTESIE